MLTGCSNTDSLAACHLAVTAWIERNAEPMYVCPRSRRMHDGQSPVQKEHHGNVWLPLCRTRKVEEEYLAERLAGHRRIFCRPHLIVVICQGWKGYQHLLHTPWLKLAVASPRCLQDRLSMRSSTFAQRSYISMKIWVRSIYSGLHPPSFSKKNCSVMIWMSWQSIYIAGWDCRTTRHLSGRRPVLQSIRAGLRCWIYERRKAIESTEFYRHGTITRCVCVRSDRSNYQEGRWVDLRGRCGSAMEGAMFSEGFGDLRWLGTAAPRAWVLIRCINC